MTRQYRHLAGEWRARRMSGGRPATVAHVWREPMPPAWDDLPVCGARIRRGAAERVTQPIATNRPCYDCLAYGASGRPL